VSSAHFMVDSYSNMYAPLLPLIIPRLGLSLMAAGALATLFQVAASLSQLAFGRLADRWRPRALLVGGPFAAAIFLSLIGLAESRGWLALFLVCGGLGVAAFHPPGALVAHRAGGSRPGLAMSVFVTCGTMGFSVTPLLVAPVAERHGLGATTWMLIPGLIVFTYFLRRAPAMPVPDHHAARGLAPLAAHARTLTLLYFVVVLRTMVSLSFATFVPVLLAREGLSVTRAGVATAVYLFASAVGGFWGGPAADRFGARLTIFGSLVAAVPFMLLAPLGSAWVFTMLIAVGGCFLQSTQPVSVSFAQALVPSRAGTVSSLMMGAAWGMGAMLTPVVGSLADVVGLRSTLVALGALPILGASLAWRLPDTAVHHPARAAAGVGIAEPVDAPGNDQ
jgi:MFS transporter, FSR family, fosmidomycin resistance protein